MRAIEAGLRYLLSCGIKHIFGIPAGSINALYDSLFDIPEFRPIVTKHETGAGYMAIAYTRITGIPSVCVGSSGPGAMNLVTAAANAQEEKLPIIFITGLVPSTKLGKGGAQELDANPVFSSITKYSTTVFDAHELVETIAAAYSIAVQGVPGPVHIQIPIDIQMSEIGQPVFPLIPKPKRKMDESNIGRAVELVVNTGVRGALLLGFGAKSAKSAIVQFVEETGWLVATTPRGKGAFPEDHALSLGVYGMSGHKKAISYMNGNSYDVLMVVGSSLGELATCNWEPLLAAGKHLIHIDIDESEFGKNYHTDVTICGDASLVMERILLELEIRTNFQGSSGTERHQNDSSIRNKLEKVELENYSTSSVIRQISKCAPDNTRFYVDIGEMMTYSIQNLYINNERQFNIDLSYGAMGSGIGGAIGAKLAEPGRPVICITGDGCFFMHGMEILTAKEYHLPVLFIVINNARLGMVYHGHMMQYNRCLGDFSQDRVDITDMVRALGICAVQVNSLEDMKESDINRWLDLCEPVVIEVIVDGEEIPPMGERVKFLEGATY
jgi:acetolactate synthase I/II/III large subunit